MHYFQTGFIPLAQNKIFFDVFNGVGSGKILQVSCIMVQKNFSAVTGVPFQMDLYRTTTPGTGGSSLQIENLDTADALIPAEITARSAPTSGASLGSLVYSKFFHSEETNQAAAVQEAFPMWPPPFPFFKWTAMPVVREGHGLALKQIANTVAGTYNVWISITH